MAKECQTPGAQFHFAVRGQRVEIAVDLPESIVITAEQAARIEGDGHDALEAILAPLFSRAVAAEGRFREGWAAAARGIERLEIATDEWKSGYDDFMREREKDRPEKDRPVTRRSSPFMPGIGDE